MLLSSPPFINSTAGAITLMLATAAVAFLFTYVPLKFKEARVRDDSQLVILTRLQTAVIPADRMGLVERVEQLERNMDITTRELEAHIELSKDEKRRLESAIDKLKSEMEHALMSRRVNGQRG